MRETYPVGPSWYDDSGGDLPVLVLLHAFPLHSALFDRVLPLLTPHLRVIRVDLPGLGRSASCRPDPPSMSAVARSLVEVLDAAGVVTATLWGISTGGYAALAAAALAPDRVAALVLSSTTPWLGEPDVPSVRREVADEVERDHSTAAVMGSVRGGLGDTAQRDQPDLVDLVAGWIRAADPDGVAWIARAIAAREDTSQVLASFAGRVLLLFGEEDHETPDDTVEQMSGLCPAAETVVLERTGHLVALEQPARSAAAVLAFVD